MYRGFDPEDPYDFKSVFALSIPSAKDKYKLSSSASGIDGAIASADMVYDPDVVEKNVVVSNAILDGLAEDTRPLFVLLYRKAFESGILPSYYSGYRSFASQQALYDTYKQGGSQYPAAAPGNSRHNYGKAVDMRVMAFSGKGLLPGGLARMNTINEAWNLGLVWGIAFDDAPHFHDPEPSLSALKKISPEYQAWKNDNPVEALEVETIEQHVIKAPIPTPTFWSKYGYWLTPILILLLVGVVSYVVIIFTEDK